MSVQRGNFNLLLILGIVAVLAIAGFFLFQKQAGPIPPGITTSQTTSSPASSTSDWDRYKETRMEQILLEEKDFSFIPEGKTDVVYQYNARGIHNPYKVRLVYKNEYRKISPKRIQFLSNWAKSLKSINDGIEGHIKLFENEVLLVDGDTEYWMPIQTKLIPFLKEEVKLNGFVDVFIMFVGTYSEPGEINWVFIINDFEVQKR